MVKASAYNAGDLGLIPGSGRFPGEGKGNPLQNFVWKIPWKESLADCSPWGRKESDMTERLHFDFHFIIYYLSVIPYQSLTCQLLFQIIWLSSVDVTRSLIT